MAADLKIGIGIDIQDFLTGLQKGNKSLQDFRDQLVRFKSALANTTDPTTINRLNKAIESSEAKIKVITTLGTKAGEGMQKAATGANSASQALINVGRVAQDSAFGFIGIANNLNPLLESFQRLRAETGSNKAALSALGSSLLGGGGLGLALSAVTAAVSFASIGFSAWTRGLNSNSAALDENEKKVKELSDARNNAFKDAASEASQVISLISVLKSEVETRERKNEALKELREINPQIFSDLKLEGETVSGLDEAYKKYIENLKIVIAAKIKQAQIEQQVEKLLKLQGSTLVGNEKAIFGATQQALNATINKLNSLDDAAAKGTAQALLNVKQKAADNIAFVENEIKRLTEELSQLSAGIKLKVDTSSESKRSADDVLRELRAQIALLNREEIQFNTDKSSERFNAFLGAIKELVIKFKKDIGSDFIQGLIDEAKIAKLGFIIKDKFITEGKALRDAVKNEFIAAPLEFEIPVDFKLNSGVFPGIDLGPILKGLPNEADIEQTKLIGFLLSQGIKTGFQDGAQTAVDGLRFPQLKALADDAKKQLESFRTLIAGLVQDTFIAIGDAIGNVIATAINGGSFGDVFKQLFSTLGAGLKQLGVYVIASSKLIAAIKAEITAAPLLAIPLGIALIALGTAVQATISKSGKGFASGGLVNGPGSGTSDSIAALLSNGEFVLRAQAVQRIGVPALERMNSGQSLGNIETNSQPVTVFVEGEISGDVIRIANARSIKRNGRNT